MKSHIVNTIGSTVFKLTKNKTVRNGAIFSFFSFANSGISFLLLLVLAKFITPASYGQLNLFTTLVTLVSIFISLSTVSYIAVSFFKKSREELLKVINVGVIVSSIVLVFLFSTVTIFQSFFERVVGIDIRCQQIAILICYFQVFNAVNLDIWRLEEKPVAYGLYSMSVVLLNAGITLFLVIGLDQDWLGRVYSQLIVGIVFFIVSVCFLFKRGYIQFKLPEIAIFKETLIYALPIIPHLMSFWLRQGADRYIINSYHSSEEVGLYSFAANFASIITIAGTAFNATNSVFIYKKLAEGYSATENTLSRQTRFVLMFFAILTITVIGVVSIVLPWAVPQYVNCIPFILPVCAAAFFYCFYLQYVNYLFYYERTVNLMCITFSFSFLQVCLSMLFTKYGVIYTAYISLFIAMCIAGVVYLVAKNVLKEFK